MHFDDLVSMLRERFLSPLPGERAQSRMFPPVRKAMSAYLGEAFQPKESSVMILLFPRENIPHVVLIRRNEYAGHHSGQISFPGGKKDPSDESHEETALRETYEEIGIPPEQVNLLGVLSDVYIPVSNFLVKPFVAYMAGEPSFLPDAKEVSEIVPIPFSVFMHEVNKAESLVSTHLGQSFKTPCYMAGDKIIWGATAIMLSELEEMVKEMGERSATSF